MHLTFVLSSHGVTDAQVTPSNSKVITWTIDQQDAGKKLVDQVQRWMTSYAKGIEEDCPPINLSHQTPFTQRVLRFLQTIPFGETLTYGEIAQRMGSPRSSRAVGAACGRNPVLVMVPCHRVLAAGGKLGGFTAGLEIKRQLLAHEGIRNQR